MKRLTAAALAGTLLVLMALTVAQAEYKHQFTGAKKCKVCHMSKKRGNQWQIWLDSKHAKAYETLATDKAKALAKGDKSPQEDPACLKCHAAGYDAPAELLGSGRGRNLRILSRSGQGLLADENNERQEAIGGKRLDPAEKGGLPEVPQQGVSNLQAFRFRCFLGEDQARYSGGDRVGTNHAGSLLPG